jgi:hypothetical protein
VVISPSLVGALESFSKSLCLSTGQDFSRIVADFQDLSPGRFHNHAPIIFMIMHPQFSSSFTHRFHDHAPTLGSSLSSSLLPGWQSFGSIHYRVLSASLRCPPFGAKAYFAL